jgi:hypothetical protein
MTPTQFEPSPSDTQVVISLGALIAWLTGKHGAVKPTLRRFRTGFPTGASYVSTQLVFAQPGTDISDLPDYLTPTRGVVADLDVIAYDPLNESQRLLTELQELGLAAGDPTKPFQFPN